MASGAKMKSRHPSQFLIVAVLALAGVGIYCVAVIFESSRLAPPTGCATLECFMQNMPPAVHLSKITWNGQSRIVWIGDRMRGLSLPSGPACYVFDQNGQLIDWSPETGEGGVLDEISSIARGSPNVGIKQLIPMIRP